MGPVVIAVGLVLLVIYLARKDPLAGVDPNQANRQPLGPDTSIAATGLTTSISPAMGSGDAKMMSGANMLRLGTNFKITAMNASKVAINATKVAAATVLPDASMGPTQADSSLPTQTIKPVVGYKIPGAGITTNTNPTIRKL